MASRLGARLRVISSALWHSAIGSGARKKPTDPKRILIAHHLLLGDTLMLTALLAKIRARYPQAEIVLATHPAFLPLYETKPYGVVALAYSPTQPATLTAFRSLKPYELALVPGDNRYSWLARALNARWIVALDGDRPRYKSWPIDELIPFPRHAMTVADMMCLLVDGPAPAPFRTADWPAPNAAPLDFPTAPYVVLHVGAGSPLRHWPAKSWQAVVDGLQARGYQPVFSGSASDRDQIAAIDPRGALPSYAGRTDLAQLWKLLQHAALLICPDTGIAHLGRIVGVPTVALFGQGSPALFGAGEFWRESPFAAVTLPDFPCRDQRTLFKREADWIRRCHRNTQECGNARCMNDIAPESVLAAVAQLHDKITPC